MPCVAICLWYASKYLASVLIYNGDDESTSGGASSDRKWYQISKVPEVEGTYNIFGFDFQSPSMIMLTFIRRNMGSVIHELLNDD